MQFKFVFTTPRQAQKAVDWIVWWGRKQSMRIDDKVTVGYEGTRTIIPEMPSFLERKFNQQWGATKVSKSSTTVYCKTPTSDFFKQLWPSGCFSDVTLRVGQEYFCVHKAVLGVISPYFRSLFTTMKEASQNTIELKATDPLIFKQVLDLV